MIKFNETKLTTNENFYSNLHLKNITDKDYEHGKNIWIISNMKNLGEYHYLYVQSDTLLLSDVFEAFRKIHIKECELYPTYFVSAPGLSWEACLTPKLKLELITDVDIFLMYEQGIRGGI